MTEAKAVNAKSKKSLLKAKNKKAESKSETDKTNKTHEYTTVAFAHFPGLDDEVRRVQIRGDVAGKARGYGKDWCVNVQQLLNELMVQRRATVKIARGAKGWMRALKLAIYSNYVGYGERPNGSANPTHTEMRRAAAYLLSALLLDDPVTAIRMVPILRGYRACGSGVQQRIEAWVAKLGGPEVDGRKALSSTLSFTIQCPDTNRKFQIVGKPTGAPEVITVLEVTDLDESLTPVLLACMEDPRSRDLITKNLPRFRASASTQYTPPEANEDEDLDEDCEQPEREAAPRSAVERYRTLVGIFDRLDQEKPLTGDLRSHAKRIVAAWREMARTSG